MNNPLSPRLAFSAVAALGMIGTAITVQAAATFTETAADPYYDTNWGAGTSGSSQPAKFGWFLSNSSVSPGYSGRFLGSSTGLAGPGADIDTSGRSWGMYGGSGGTGQGYSDAYGFLKDGLGNDGPLSVGQTLSLDIAVNWRNGFKGVDVRNFGNDANIFNFNIGGDDYVVNNATTGNGSIGNDYSDNTAFQLAFTQTSASGGIWEIIRSGGVSDYDTGTYTGLISSFKLYVGNTDAGSANDFYANSISVVPEPTTFALGGLGLAAMLLLRRRA